MTKLEYVGCIWSCTSQTVIMKRKVTTPYALLHFDNHHVSASCNSMLQSTSPDEPSHKLHMDVKLDLIRSYLRSCCGSVQGL